MQLIISQKVKEVNLRSIRRSFFNSRGKEGKRFFFLFSLPNLLKKKTPDHRLQESKISILWYFRFTLVLADSVDSS